MAKNKGIGQKIILVRRENKRPAGVTENFDQEKVEILGAIACQQNKPQSSRKKRRLIKPVVLNNKIYSLQKQRKKLLQLNKKNFLSPRSKIKNLFYITKEGVNDDKF